MKQLFTFFILCIVMSCTKTGKTDNLQSTQLIPLSINNEWVYTTEFYDTSGNPLPFNGSETTYDDTLRYSDTVINDTTWYTDLPSDSFALMSTADKVYGYNLVDSISTGLYLESTDKDSEIIYQNSGERYEKLVAYSKIFNVNGYDAIKNVDSIFYDNNLDEYIEYYIKPGLGLVETNYYWANYHADGSTSFSLRRRETLKSYSFH